MQWVCVALVHVHVVGKVDDETMNDYEALVGIVAPGKTLTVDVEPKNAFVIRWVSVGRDVRRGGARWIFSFAGLSL